MAAAPPTPKEVFLTLPCRWKGLLRQDGSVKLWAIFKPGVLTRDQLGLTGEPANKTLYDRVHYARLEALARCFGRPVLDEGLILALEIED